MKKLILILLFVPLLSFGQGFGNSYGESKQQIKYVDATLHLKEILAMQALLSENRINEFTDFTDKNFYINTEGQSFSKYDVSKDQDVHIGFNIFENTEDYSSPFGLLVLYMINTSEGARNFESMDEINKFKRIILKSLDIGTLNMFGFNNMVGQISKKSPEMIKIHDRYNASIKSGDGWMKMRVSNTVKMGVDKYSFFGPGKTTRTDLEFLSKNTEKGYLFAIRVTSYYGQYRTKDGEIGNSINKNPFNLSFFMALQNLNDRIWDDI